MVQRVTGKSKLTPQVRQRLAVVAAELRGMVYGEAGCPAWGTLFAEIEDDAKEVGHEIIRLVMQQSADQQAEDFPAAALTTEGGRAGPVGRETGAEAGDRIGPGELAGTEGVPSEIPEGFFSLRRRPLG